MLTPLTWSRWILHAAVQVGFVSRRLRDTTGHTGSPLRMLSPKRINETFCIPSKVMQIKAFLKCHHIGFAIPSLFFLSTGLICVLQYFGARSLITAVLCRIKARVIKVCNKVRLIVSFMPQSLFRLCCHRVKCKALAHFPVCVCFCLGMLILPCTWEQNC